MFRVKVLLFFNNFRVEKNIYSVFDLLINDATFLRPQVFFFLVRWRTWKIIFLIGKMWKYEIIFTSV